MRSGKAYLLFWLTVQWLLAGPLLALFGMAMLFSDEHGLPTGNAGFLVIYLILLTVGFGYALRVTTSLQKED